MKQPDKTHWTHTYRSHGNIIYEVDSDLYQNTKLTRSEIDIVENLAGGNLKTPILDLACGPGRHSIEFLRRGYRGIYGMDHSAQFIKIARSRLSAQDRKSIRFSVGDTRFLPFSDCFFQTVILIGNSFGYFSDSDNARVVSEVSRVLAPKGTFILDVTRKEFSRKMLVPFEIFYPRTSVGDVIDIRERRWDQKTRRIRCRKIHIQTTHRKGSQFVRLDQPKLLLDTYYEIRQFDSKELLSLLRQHGLYGKAFDDNALGKKMSLRNGLASHRMWICAIKK